MFVQKLNIVSNAMGQSLWRFFVSRNAPKGVENPMFLLPQSTERSPPIGFGSVNSFAQIGLQPLA